ncbi:MAG: hypothetical protein RIF39_15105, partial [Cyclobacteriaceae bacterium]
LAKGNLTFNGLSVPMELWFKTIAPLVSGTSKRTGFEGRFLMNAKGDFGINSGSVEDAILTITISIFGSTTI